MPLVFKSPRHFSLMARSFLIGFWIDLCETGRHKFHTICGGETTRLVTCLMLFVSLFWRVTGHTHVVTVFARLVVGIVIAEFTVRQYRWIQLDDVDHEALRVVGRHFKLIKMTVFDHPETYRAFSY